MASDVDAASGHRWVCCGTGPDGAGIEAFSALVPRGWSAEGGLRWDRSTLDPTVTPRFRAWAPDGFAGVELTVATLAHGAVPDAAGYVLADVLPALRPSATAIHVLEVRSADRIPWPAIGVERTTLATVAVAYLDDGTAWREEVTVALGGLGPDGDGWCAAPGLALRARSDEFDVWSPLLGRVRDSFTVSEGWAAALAPRPAADVSVSMA